MVTIHEDQYTLLTYLAQFFLEWEMFQTKFVQKIENQFTFDTFLSFFFFLIVLFKR